MKSTSRRYNKFLSRFLSACRVDPLDLIYFAILVLALLLPGASEAVSLASDHPPAPARFTAKVVHVDDGDTVVVLSESKQQIKIRLANIDAPETGHGNCRPGQPWSQQSTVALKQLVLGSTILLNCSAIDRYGRSVCDLHLGAGTASPTANQELVRLGLAWANRARPQYLRDPKVAPLEEQARTARAGLWRDDSAIPPWEWRKTAWTSPQPGCERSLSWQ